MGSRAKDDADALPGHSLGSCRCDSVDDLTFAARSIDCGSFEHVLLDRALVALGGFIALESLCEFVGVMVVFGQDASDETRREAWDTVSSLTAPSVIDPPSDPVCVVTLPHREASPGLIEAVGDRTLTPNQRWYGTPGLWTALPNDGVYGVRKSVWWSEEFEGGRTEPQPGDIGGLATARRRRGATPSGSGY